MAPTKVFSVPKSEGEILTAAEINGLDDQQFDRIARSGTSTLTAATVVDLAGFDLTVSTAGAGLFRPVAETIRFGGSAYPRFSTPRTVTDWVPPCGFSTNVPAIWTPEGLYWEATGAPNVSQFLYFPLSLPAGIALDSLKLTLLNPTAGSLPTNMPTVEISRRAVGSTSVTSLGSGTDASADVPTYNAAHTIVVSGLAHGVAHGFEYYVVVRNEYGGTSSVGLRVYRPALTISVDALRAI